MNSYKKLINNTFIFAVGTLGSKLVNFLLVPLYTYYLSTAEYGTVDLTLTTVNMLLPIVSISAYEAVFRFTMDKEKDPTAVLTNSILIALAGYFIALLFYPVLKYFNVLEGNLIYLYLLLFVMMIEKILAQYTRASGKVKLFAMNGILLTFTTGIFNILFLAVLELGVIGYYWALILAYLISVIFLLFATGTIKELQISKGKRGIIKELVNFSIPMIPNSLMWWLINASSRYFIRFFVGISANGLFAVASRIPSLLTILYQVFNQSWQLSAVEEYESDSKSSFYTRVFDSLFKFMFIGSSAILIVVKIIFSILFAEEYFTAWRVVPFLLLGAVFSSFSSFLGSNYVAAKQTKGVFKTSVYGGIISLVLNLLLIPTAGLIGAGISSMASFFMIFLIRYYDTKQYINLEINWLSFGLNSGLIFAQIGILFIGLDPILEIIIQLIFFTALMVVNRKLVMSIIKLALDFVLSKLNRKS